MKKKFKLVLKKFRTTFSVIFRFFWGVYEGKFEQIVYWFVVVVFLKAFCKSEFGDLLCKNEGGFLDENKEDFFNRCKLGLKDWDFLKITKRDFLFKNKLAGRPGTPKAGVPRAALERKTNFLVICSGVLKVIL